MKKSAREFDENDNAFVKTLINTHKKYIEARTKTSNLDSSALNPQYANIYDKISHNFPIREVSKNNKELYNNYDLMLGNEEAYNRYLRSEIVKYLENKSNKPIQLRKVNLFLNKVLKSESNNERSIENENCNELFEEVLIANDDYDKFEAILEPYIEKMKTQSNVDCETAHKSLLEAIHQKFIEKILNEKILNEKILNERKLFEKTETVSKLDNANNSNISCNEEKIESKSEEMERLNNDTSLVAPIEISDDENETIDMRMDFNKIVDFIMHQCFVDHDLYPFLLTDNQMNVECNGFLLFVNYGIRCSMRYLLNSKEHKIFLCIFITSMIVGLQCKVDLNNKGLFIGRLNTGDYHIINARLMSIEVAIANLFISDNLYTLVILPDIDKLKNILLHYVTTFLKTRKLQ